MLVSLQYVSVIVVTIPFNGQKVTENLINVPDLNLRIVQILSSKTKMSSLGAMNKRFGESNVAEYNATSLTEEICGCPENSDTTFALESQNGVQLNRNFT